MILATRSVQRKNQLESRKEYTLEHVMLSGVSEVELRINEYIVQAWKVG